MDAFEPGRGPNYAARPARARALVPAVPLARNMHGVELRPHAINVVGAQGSGQGLREIVTLVERRNRERR